MENIKKLDYELFCKQICKFVPFDKDLDKERNLLELGLTSLQMMRLANNWRRQGYKISFSQMISYPYVSKWWELLNFEYKKNVQEETVNSVKDIEGPFELTDVQYAYWIGRRSDQVLGGNGCHAYFEFESQDINIKRLEEAWYLLQKHHSMLRARFLPNGMQEILEKPYSNKLKIYHLQGKKNIPNELENIRKNLSHRMLNIESGQVAELGVSILNNKIMLHFDIDLLVADMQSLQIIFRDLASLYVNGSKPKAKENWNFASYLDKEKLIKKKDLESSKQYWQEKINKLSLAPELPLAVQIENIKSPHFNRKKYLLDNKQWNELKRKAAKNQTTPAMVLLTAYIEILDRWSSNSEFLINVPIFDRETSEEGVDDAVADFTNVLLFNADCNNKCTFLERLKTVESQFHNDIAHSAYSGVKVIRDLSKIHPGEKNIAPVVFSCNYGNQLISEEFTKAFGKLNYMISQTPQVWIDFQVFELEGGLHLSWDVIDSLFYDGMPDKMFNSYVNLIKSLLTEDSWNNTYDVLEELPKVRGIEDIKVLNNNSNKLLHSFFFEQAKKNKSNIALIDQNDGLKYTYEELSTKALKVAAYLQKEGVSEKDLVAISLPRGVNQVVAILGILAIGAGYIPINVKQPLERRKSIYKKANVKYSITDGNFFNNLKWPSDIKVINISEANNIEPLSEIVDYKDSNSAYIIFTSGSTGEPKGVEIAHSAAVNTIIDINNRYNVNENDKILAVSSYDFDLSVYDIFGVLSAGGSLVLIKEDINRDATAWLDIVNNVGITLWNSVPTLLNMLLIVAESNEVNIPSLRVAMLSGDWIVLDIPMRLKNIAENSHLVAMGGATEASIWSNYFDVTLPIPCQWKSIPYGKPLTNQYYRIVDDKGYDCPNLVPGELWIGGAGVAKGYIGDPKITEKSFVTWNKNIWYRTGDMGRYLSDGNIEFLGRRDFQVKVRGHRIELGEIESAMKKYSGIDNSVVSAVGDAKGNKHLVGYIVPEEGYPESLFSKKEIDSNEMENKWIGINKSYKNIEVLNFEDVAEKEKYPILNKCIDDISVIYICRIFNKLKIAYETNKIYSIDNLMEKGSIDESYKALIMQWIDTLINRGVIKKLSDATYMNIQSLSAGVTNELEIIENNSEFEDVLHNLIRFLKPFEENSKKLLTGTMDTTQLLLSKDYISPAQYMKSLPGETYKNELIRQTIEYFNKNKKDNEPIKILEIGARSIEDTKTLLKYFSASNLEYTCSDSSVFYINSAKTELSNYSNLEFKQFDINDDPIVQDIALHNYDIVISFNSLHRSKNLNKSLKYTQNLLKAGGILLLVEATTNTIMQQVSTGILEKGFINFDDSRREIKLPLLTANKWIETLDKNGFIKSAKISGQGLKNEIYNQSVMIAMSPLTIETFNSEGIKGLLEDMLPSYMIPTSFMIMNELPLSANGKINRKLLPVPNISLKDSTSETYIAPSTSLEILLAKIWKEVLKVNKVGMNDNYFELGGDSLLATQLNSIVNKEFKINVPLETIFEKPIFSEQVIYIASLLEDQEVKNLTVDQLPKVIPDKDNWNEPFPLTDVQQSYWIGRNGGFALGDVSTHCYFEMNCKNVDVEKLKFAWQKLIKRHGMMRAVFLPDGQNQRIFKNAKEYEIKEYNLRYLKDSKASIEIEKIRNEMSHQTFNTDCLFLFDVRISTLPNSDVRLHISFDNIIFDGWSMFYILREWKKLHDNENLELPPLELSFRDYVLAYEKIKGTDLYKRDEAYWKNRLKEIAPAPNLPVVQNSNSLSSQHFVRFETKLKEEKWKSLKSIAAKNGLTASGFLLTAYAEILGKWSKSSKFTINLTRFNRLPIHDQIMDVVGDFTSLTLLSVDNTNGTSFMERCKNLQKQLWQDLGHPYYSGVELERELSKNYNKQQEVIMPIVFTSGLGIKKGHDDDEYLGKMVYGLSQTPQVWIDHQVTEQDNELVLTWDAVREIFPDGMLDDMFSAYIELLNSLAEREEFWNKQTKNLVNIPRLESRIKANNTEKNISNETLISLLERSFKENSDRNAIISSEKQIAYYDLFKYTNGIAHMLIDDGIETDNLVAIVMEKGWEQIPAATAVLKSGAAYLPIDPENPDERIKFLLKSANVKVVLTQSWIDKKIEWPINVKRICIDKLNYKQMDTTDFTSKAKPQDLAYVIYTSGSTGVPKGVMIEHQGAVNTIVDVNERFNVGKNDKCIALSNLNFDLSVYDVFGLLIAGGQIVIPNSKEIKEPSHWLKLINKYDITVWNSVPAFMQMFMEYLSGKPENSLSLKLVIMSGDWIPLELPNSIKKHSQNVRVISMGGATEASIWSNYFEIKDIDKNWRSIPYGKPLSNQKFYILDNEMNDCPTWVPGRLYIAGSGLARGYWNDLKRTEERFIVHPHTGERLYYTGDLGKYWSDGNIEFLGREDSQVKIRGHRIELGEIENVLQIHKDVKNAVVIVEKDKNGLGAAVLLQDNVETNVEMLHEYLQKKLPEYLVPNKIIIMDKFPLNINGKVDHKALREILSSQQKYTLKNDNYEAAKDELERDISKVWEEVIGVTKISRNEDFFLCGGDSLKAVKIVSELKARGISTDDLAIQTLFIAPTIALFAEKIRELSIDKEDGDVDYEEGVL